VELTLEAVGPIGLPSMEDAKDAALKVLEETLDGLTEQLNEGLEKLVQQKAEETG
jgi:hypothetical protein